MNLAGGWLVNDIQFHSFLNYTRNYEDAKQKGNHEKDGVLKHAAPAWPSGADAVFREFYFRFFEHFYGKFIGIFPAEYYLYYACVYYHFRAGDAGLMSAINNRILYGNPESGSLDYRILFGVQTAADFLPLAGGYAEFFPEATANQTMLYSLLPIPNYEYRITNNVYPKAV